jgi:hypothetical protein
VCFTALITLDILLTLNGRGLAEAGSPLFFVPLAPTMVGTIVLALLCAARDEGRSPQARRNWLLAIVFLNVVAAPAFFAADWIANDD